MTEKKLVEFVLPGQGLQDQAALLNSVQVYASDQFIRKNNLAGNGVFPFHFVPDMGN
jgi:hypothetical protein